MAQLILTFLLIITTTSVIGLYFECQYEYLSLGPVIGTGYSCYGQPIGDWNDPYVRGITGEHYPGRNDSDVLNFRVWNDNRINFIPRGLTEFFPNMIGIAVVNCSVFQLYQDDLNGYVNLQAFSFSANYIERIPQGFFEYTPNILTMSMTNNRITQVGPDLLAPLATLTAANWNNNTCVDMFATIETLHELQYILNTNCTYHGN